MPADAPKAARERARLQGLLQPGAPTNHGMQSRRQIQQTRFDEFLEKHDLNTMHHDLPTKAEARGWIRSMDKVIESSVVSTMFQRMLFDNDMAKHVDFYKTTKIFAKERSAPKRTVMAKQIWNDYLADSRPDRIHTRFYILRKTIDNIKKHSRPSTSRLAHEFVQKKLKEKYESFINTPEFRELYDIFD
ncbi:hypothetical protein CAEBREN_09939 [Caenorhabditis brenneri]|uniref:RGS domain-containing protein n=1 Tax=Caenorhabditis brenneri TaxID=135651 RepID=G0NB85_CAEBE|nr:hypothetical protein CAEBREN_09939 [Caenorhabditis brenneri]